MFEELDGAGGGSRENLPVEWLLDVVIVFFTAMIFGTLGAAAGPRLVSIVMWFLVAGYILTLYIDGLEEYSWIIAAAAVALHIGAVVGYYSNPIILPLVIIERGNGYESINIDFIQAIFFFEIGRRLARKKLKRTAPGSNVAGGTGTPR